MSHDITASLESAYEPSHDEADQPVVVGSTCRKVSDEPLCGSPGDDYEKQF